MSDRTPAGQLFPSLDAEAIATTRDAMHAYARILGSWAAVCRAKRKHWWHASLRPSIHGVSTGVIYTPTLQFEVALNFRESQLTATTATGDVFSIELHGQAAKEVAGRLDEFLRDAGMSDQLADAVAELDASKDLTAFGGYSAEQADRMARAMGAVSSTMVSFRAGIREETSPIQLWPHHFDLAMLWLPGAKIAGQDPDNEEYADQQMNFGFTFGDTGIPEPYFYVTAYPSPPALAELELPTGTDWKSDGFTGAVLTWQRLAAEAQPGEYLLALWNRLLAEGRQYLI